MASPLKKTMHLLLAATITITMTGCSWTQASLLWWNNYPSDNVIEEYAEELLDDYTGYDLDLSPFSPEDE